MAKIAYIIPRFYPFKGGAEENIFALASRAVQKGHDVTVLTTSTKFRNENLERVQVYEGIKIVRFWSLNKALYAGFYPELLIHLIGNNYDIIHSSGIGFFWREFCLIIERITSRKTKFITTPHGPFMALGDTEGLRGAVRKYGTIILRAYLNRLYDYFIAINSKQYEWMEALYKINKEKIIVIPNGINSDYIEKEIVQHTPEDKVVITYLNRIEWYKGIQDVVKAIARLLDPRSTTSKNFVFYIMGKSGGYTQKLKELITELEVEEYVKFILHPTDEERDRIFLEESQINILPSKWEGTGITLIEAMAKGNVIITTTGNEAADILIKNGSNGFIYEFGDIDRLKDILKKLINDSALRQEMRKENLKLSHNFTWESVVPDYFKLLDKLLNK
jgi:glycosyltransferase involved in cell wall biosynthesis